MNLPLPYQSIKNGNHPQLFFGKFLKSSVVNNIEVYNKIIDITKEKVYERPFLTSNGFTAPAQYFLEGEKQLTFSLVFSVIAGKNFTTLGTAEGNYLIVSTPEDTLDEAKLVSKIYNVIAKSTKAYATRHVIAADRQVHWVWFRKSPTYKLTEEIILRAASWIELNPGYVFHLWTNLKDGAELEDFISDLDERIRDRYFRGAISVHYESEFRECVFTWIQKHTPELENLYLTVWASAERHNIIMKTDYSRNILLAVHGGIYADFNDLLCLAPIEPVLEAHAGRCIGVTDNTNVQNTSNYFMYAAQGCPQWLDLTIRCIRTMPSVYSLIYDADALEVARAAVKDMADGKMPNIPAIQSCVDRGFQYNLDHRHFIYAITYSLINTALGIDELKILVTKSMYGRMKRDFVQQVIFIFQNNSSMLKEFAETKDFEVAWRFGRTDMYLSPIMHRSNLPIFAREQKTPMTLLPFGYLLRYANMISFVGHLGDGSSFGRDAKNSITIRNLLGV